MKSLLPSEGYEKLEEHLHRHGWNILYGLYVRAEEMASMAVELASQAQQLQQTIAYFKTNGMSGEQPPSEALPEKAGQPTGTSVPEQVPLKENIVTMAPNSVPPSSDTSNRQSQPENPISGDSRDAEFEHF